MERTTFDLCAAAGDPTAPQDSRSPMSQAEFCQPTAGAHPRAPPHLPGWLCAPFPPALAVKLPKPHPMHLWQGGSAQGQRAPLTLNPGPGMVSGDTAQLADVPAEDKNKSLKFPQREALSSRKQKSQDQRILPDRRDLLPLSGASDVFCVLSRPGSRVVTGMGTNSLRQGSFSLQWPTLSFQENQVPRAPCAATKREEERGGEVTH